MKYTKLKIKELILKSEEKELLLPNFQREFVWDRSGNQKDLLASILYNIPIGSLLILNGESNFFATKELCLRNQNLDIHKENILYLLDGQQRISTLKSMFFDFFSNLESWRENYDNIYPKLRTRWFVKIIPNEKQIDLFGWNKLKFGGINTFNNYTPKDIEEFIDYEIINVNQKEKWFHPEFKLEEYYDEEKKKVNVNSRNNIISKEAAEEGKLPLYSIFEMSEKNSGSLQYKILKKIASNRIEQLKSAVEDGELDIENIFGCYDEESIDEAWQELANDWVSDVKEFFENIENIEIPIIQLSKEEMSRAIYTFEYVNKGGTALSTYDLIVAKAAHDEKMKSLTDRIKNIIDQDIVLPDSLVDNLKNICTKDWNARRMDVLKDNELCNFIKNQYLNLLSIFSYLNYESDVENIRIEHIKKDKHLNLDSKQINENTEITIRSLIRAFAFLQYRCGIVKIDDLSYELMILPIAYILRNDSFWNDKKVISKIEYWYWTSLFGGAYRERPNEQCIEDIKKLYNWIVYDNNSFIEREKRVLNVEGYSDYNTLIFNTEEKKIPKAIYKGILQYVLSKQPKDFINDDIYLNAWEIAYGKEYYFNIKGKSMKILIQDHHICPLSNATKIGESSKKLRNKKGHILNTPLNRTYISSIANGLISDKKPEEYFKYVSQMAKYGHCIPSPIEEKYKVMENEDENKYYERIAKQRYDEIKRDLELELEKLRSC
ncbi:hypothetical protein Z969_10155 [Clostridium novyi A str. 4570]|uniref:GmrSD restriction endonucleases N-terminal domain-containing protein n=1 Tax=Clostridium novyi A str. 4570 TaxID=1444290 RepID=A0AA89CU42_CLONO|nr:DUF262 domain-containing protein [Clostridium novyi]KGN00090.1 hypothetical protein Z969_10155 [Clostridium novyi A str. 4570]